MPDIDQRPDSSHSIRKQRLRVVLAHVERYDEFQKDRSAWDEVFSLPLIPQINTGSFIKKKTGLFRTDKKRKFAMQFLKTHPDVSEYQLMQIRLMDHS